MGQSVKSLFPCVPPDPDLLFDRIEDSQSWVVERVNTKDILSGNELKGWELAVDLKQMAVNFYGFDIFHIRGDAVEGLSFRGKDGDPDRGALVEKGRGFCGNLDI